MPVSTRSQISDGRDEVRPRMIEPPPASLMGNPHQGLKEKMKALTLYYEQHRTQMAGAGRRSFTFRTEQQDQKQQGVDVGETTGCKMEKAAEEKRPPEPAMRGDPNVMLPTPAARRKGVGMGDTPSCKMERPEEKKEVKRPLEPLMRDNVMPPTPTARRKTVPANLMFSTASDAKENVPEQDAFPAAQEHIVVYTCPRRESTAASVPRKLSMGGGAAALAGAQTEQQRPVMRLARRVTVADTSGVAVATASDVETPADARGNRIMVFVRLRPMSKKEKETGARPCVRIVDKRDVYLTESASDATDYLRLKRLRGRHFSFDAAFPESSSQQQVYATSTAELVEGVLQGRNGSVFCYGATGAGKTYTMLGTVENPGVMVLAIKDLFNKIRQRSHDGNHVVHLSYLEVYNETVRDLLSPGRPLILRQDKQGIVAAGLTQYRAYTTDEVMALLQQGNLNRTTEPTRVNETSSRSHAILQVVAEYSERRDDGAVVGRLGKLSLIDLAGSERALATDQRTLRSLEGANINRSLLALSSCISALVEGKSHVPYRNSKLTQLLKDSLGGACHTVMIANIGPAAPSFGETQNTLHWADRAKQIKTRAPIVNEEMMVQMPESGADQAKLVLELQKENRELRQQLARQQQKLLNLQAQRLAAGSSSSSVVPATPVHPSAAASSPPRSCSIQRRTKRSLQAGNWLATPDAKNSRDVMIAQENQQQRTIKALEADLDRLKKDHILQIRQKDNFIRELIAKRDGGGSKVLPDGLDAAITVEAMGTATAERKRIVTRASLRKAPTDRSAAATELRSPGHRFLSPAPTTKKRSFWDSTVSSSPSVIKAIHDRKTKIHASASKAPASVAPSFLLQPGFTRQRQEQLKKRH